MNKVSDLNLAVACYDAGVYPSLSLFNYYDKKILNLSRFQSDLKKFNDRTGSSEILISLTGRNLFDENMIDILSGFECLRLEIIEDFYIDPVNIKKIFPQKDILLVAKEIGDSVSFDSDIIIVKGREAAGRTSKDNKSTVEKFLHFKNKYPDKFIIPSGGIGSKMHVQKFLDLGAEMVGIGTLFAATKESLISENSKMQMINHTSKDLERFEDTNQNALIFESIADDDMNHSRSLKIGTMIPDKGHLFAGSSIDNIDRLKTVKELVSELIG